MAGQVIQCSTACEVTLLVEPSPVSMDRIGDYGQLFALLLVAVVVVGLARALKNLFWSNSERD